MKSQQPHIWHQAIPLQNCVLHTNSSADIQIYTYKDTRYWMKSQQPHIRHHHKSTCCILITMYFYWESHPAATLLMCQTLMRSPPPRPGVKERTVNVNNFIVADYINRSYLFNDHPYWSCQQSTGFAICESGHCLLWCQTLLPSWNFPLAFQATLCDHWETIQNNCHYANPMNRIILSIDTSLHFWISNSSHTFHRWQQ